MATVAALGPAETGARMRGQDLATRRATRGLPLENHPI
jgi:hypothetical protein